MLEHIGSVPSHRNGASVIYGKYLRELVRQAPNFSGRPLGPTPIRHHRIAQPSTTNNDGSSSLPVFAATTAAEPIPSFNHHTPYATLAGGVSWAEPFQFSTMSSNQVNETIMNAGDFDNSLFDVSMDNAAALGWMDWMNPSDFGFANMLPQ